MCKDDYEQRINDQRPTQAKRTKYTHAEVLKNERKGQDSEKQEKPHF